MYEYTCPICGDSNIENRMKLGAHMWAKHKVKLKEYEAEHGTVQGNTIGPVVNESIKPAEKLIQPSVVKESKEFVNEQPAAFIDRDFVTESKNKDSEFVKTVKNPYRDLYPADGTVMTEWLH